MDRKKLKSMSLITLSHLSNDALGEICSGNEYNEETKMLARRVLNSRLFS